MGTHPEALALGLGPSPLSVRWKGPAKGWSQVRPQGTRDSEGRLHPKTGSWPELGLGVGRVETVGREMPSKAAPGSRRKEICRAQCTACGLGPHRQPGKAALYHGKMTGS